MTESEAIVVNAIKAKEDVTTSDLKYWIEKQIIPRAIKLSQKAYLINYKLENGSYNFDKNNKRNMLRIKGICRESKFLCDVAIKWYALIFRYELVETREKHFNTFKESEYRKELEECKKELLEIEEEIRALEIITFEILRTLEKADSRYDREIRTLVKDIDSYF